MAFLVMYLVTNSVSGFGRGCYIEVVVGVKKEVHPNDLSPWHHKATVMTCLDVYPRGGQIPSSKIS